MATLQVRLQDLATRVATEIKTLRNTVNTRDGDLTTLTTDAKTSLVAAINELQAELNAIDTGAVINDAATTSTTQTWSINRIIAEVGGLIDDVATTGADVTWSVDKIQSELTEALNGVVNGAPGALDTLDELAAALGDDANFAATITTALANRVRVDTAAQGLTLTQKQNARTNIDAFGSVELGNPDTDLVAVFETGLI